MADKQPKNSVKTYNIDPQPRVAVPQPRVQSTTPKQEIDTQLIAECLTEAVVKSLKRPIPNYIYQDEEETPARNMRSRKYIQRTIIQEAIFSAMDSTSSAPTARQCASRNSSTQFLCDLANAIMDDNGELLQYSHLMSHPEYRVMWGKDYAK